MILLTQLGSTRAANKNIEMQLQVLRSLLAD